MKYETDEIPNPVTFEFGRGLTHYKLDSPIFSRKRTQIWWRLCSAIGLTLVMGIPSAIALVVLSPGIWLTLASLLYITLPILFWISTLAKLKSLRRSSAVTMSLDSKDGQKLVSKYNENNSIAKNMIIHD